MWFNIVKTNTNSLFDFDLKQNIVLDFFAFMHNNLTKINTIIKATKPGR